MPSSASSSNSGNSSPLVPTTGPAGAPARAAKPAAAKLDELDERRTLVPTTGPAHAARPTSRPSFDAADSVTDGAKTGKRTSVPLFGPADLDLDAESSDVLPISFDDADVDEAAERPSEGMAPTVPSDPMATDALGLMAPMAFTAPQPRADGMRLGAIVAVAGIVALGLGGLTAYLVLGDDDPPAGPATVVSPAADATPASTEPKAPAVAGSEVPPAKAPAEIPPPADDGAVEVVVKAATDPAAVEEPVPSDTPTPVPEAKGQPKRPKPGPSKPKPDVKPEPKPEPDKGEPKPKPKSDVFMDSSKGKDDGIFMPVGGK
jgi:hypothetical protein